MNYHPILDWRLAWDMLDILEGGAIDIGRWNEQGARRSAEFAASVGGAVVTLDGGASGVRFDNRTLVVGHPLEDASHHLPPRLARAVADAEETTPHVVIADSFELLRRPGAVIAKLMGA
jgi:hypothetical protein